MPDTVYYVGERFKNEVISYYEERQLIMCVQCEAYFSISRERERGQGGEFQSLSKDYSNPII